MPDDKPSDRLFKDRHWNYSYKTSSITPDGRPVNILHDFYIPVLKRSIRYDRVAGYFRSSSLAAASQGFSGFTAAEGSMRLIVGADLAPGDVSAILRGDEEKMAALLNRELKDPEQWPEDVKNGVELLSWMVSRESLEVKVAFRVHSKTGNPLPIDATDDGYVHEKWGIFTDASGDRIYMTGSLNESRTALIHNAENINLHADWWGESDRQRIEEAQRSFEYLWQNQTPYIKVLSLPDAVKQQLIKIARNVKTPVEIDGSSAFIPQIKPPSAMDRLRFAVIKDGPNLPGGRFVGMETAAVKPWPHQEVVARRLVSTWPYSYLLCDEVGLGKTIEAGLAIRSLYLSGIIQRVLISPPASLTQQWHREMAAKFFLPFARVKGGTALTHEYIFPLEKSVHGDSMYDPDLCIVSASLLRGKQRRMELDSAETFDLALVDEAHYARRKNPKNGEKVSPTFGQLYQTIQNRLIPRTESLWMATATPMQLDWIEVFDLIGLTRRVAHFQEDPTLTWLYYQILGKLVREQDVKPNEWEFLNRSIFSLQKYDPFLWNFLEEAVIDGQIRPAARRWHEENRPPAGIDRSHIKRLIFAAAPLSRVMLRHTRPLLEIYREKGQLEANLAKREVLPVPRITLTGLEKKAYDDLQAYCRDLKKQIEAGAQGASFNTSIGFYLSFLRLRLASSIFALRETLKRRRKRVTATLHHQQAEQYHDNETETHELIYGNDEDTDVTIIDTFLQNRTQTDLAWEENRLGEMLKPLEDLSGMPLKMKELLLALEKQRLAGGRLRQTVIFTRFYDTLTDIVQRLLKINPNMRIGTYSGKGGQYVDTRAGKLCNVEREEIKHRFSRGEIDVLVCTDAAAEGLNLQAANLIINYDLPWNPMKVEQRIGRIDRIGQKHDRIYVLNLCYVDSAEQIVYDRLLKRLEQAGDVVGTQQISMLPVTEEEFAELAAGNLNEQTLLQQAKERLQLQKERTESMEIPAKDLYEIYMRLKDQPDQTQPPVTLEDIQDAFVQSDYLRNMGSSQSKDKAVFHLKGFENIPDDTAVTVDRDLYEKQIAGSEQPLHFASFGDPVFQEVLNTFCRYDLPDCVVRLTEKVPGMKAEMAAYAVACRNENGESEIRLITSYKDLSNLIPDEEKPLSREDIAPLKRQLRRLMRKEFEPTRSVSRLVQNNIQAGKAQSVFHLLVADSLFPNLHDKLTDNFWQAVKNMEGRNQNRDQLIVPQMPLSFLSSINEHLLLDLKLPTTGDSVSPTLPIFFIECAINAACRAADRIREPRAAVTIEKVKRRIRNEINHHMQNHP